MSSSGRGDTHAGSSHQEAVQPSFRSYKAGSPAAVLTCLIPLLQLQCRRQCDGQQCVTRLPCPPIPGWVSNQRTNTLGCFQGYPAIHRILHTSCPQSSGSSHAQGYTRKPCNPQTPHHTQTANPRPGKSHNQQNRRYKLSTEATPGVNVPTPQGRWTCRPWQGAGTLNPPRPSAGNSDVLRSTAPVGRWGLVEGFGAGKLTSTCRMTDVT